MVKSRSVIITWIWSYVAILLVPILIGVAIQLRIEKEMEDEINKSNHFYLKQVKQYLDNLVGDIEKHSTEIALSLRVQEVMNLEKPLSDQERYRIFECIQELRALKISRSPGYQFYVYFKDLDLVLNEVSVLDSREFYNIFGENESNLAYHEWLSALNKYYQGEYIPLSSRTNPSAGETKSIFYIRSLPLIRDGAVKVNIVFRIAESSLLEMTQEIKDFNKGRLLIINQENRIIADSGALKIPAKVSYEKLPDQSGLLYERQGGEEVAISYINSAGRNWKYVYTMPTRVYWEKLRYTRRLTYLSVFLCIGLGSVLTFMLLKKNYAPVQSLVKLLSQNQQTSPAFDANEYRFIQNMINKTMNDQAEVSRRLAEQNELLRARFIERLLRGHVSQENITEALITFNIRLVSDYFGVILFYANDSNSPANEHYSDDETAILFQTTLKKALKEVIDGKNNYFTSEVNGDLVCLLNFSEENLATGPAEMEQIAREVIRIVAKNTRIELAITLSGIHETVLGISQAYNEALEALEYKLIMGCDAILAYDRIKENIRGDYYYPLDKEQRMLNSIKSGDFERAQLLVGEIYHKNFQERNLSSQKARHLILNIVGTVFKAVNETGIPDENDFHEELERLEELIYQKKIGKAKEEIIEIIREFCLYRNSAKGHANQNIAGAVKEYVLRNYADEKLNIAAIAARIGLHPAYVSRLFKEEEGIGILEHINNIRIEKALLLMRDKKLNLNEVAKAVGYTNVRTFSRAFLRIYGITPGKSRE